LEAVNQACVQHVRREVWGGSSVVLSVDYLIRIEEGRCGLLLDIWDGYLVVSASEMLVSDDEGAASPTEISIMMNRIWVHLLIMADCTISIRYRHIITNFTRLD
jgi:hypothetical protein